MRINLGSLDVKDIHQLLQGRVGKVRIVNQGLALFALPIRLCLNGILVMFEKGAQKGTLDLYPSGDLMID
jgi:hypothetical protein